MTSTRCFSNGPKLSDRHTKPALLVQDALQCCFGGQGAVMKTLFFYSRCGVVLVTSSR